MEFPGIEARYRRMLIEYTRKALRAYVRTLFGGRATVPGIEAYRSDAVSIEDLARAEAAARGIAQPTDEELERIATEIEEGASANILELTGISLAAALLLLFGTTTTRRTITLEVTRRTWLDRQRELIGSLVDEFAEKVRSDLSGVDVSTPEGARRAEALVDRRLAETQRRARTIGGNEVLTGIAETEKELATGLGATGYHWESMRDNQVRPRHARNDLMSRRGHIFNYADGDPEGFNPGEEVNCRCRAVPVVPG